MTQAPRATQAGTLDPTFAEDGVLRLPLPGISGYEMAAVLALPEKKLVVAIPSREEGYPTAIMRLNEDGTLDTEFGGKETGFVEVSLENASMNPIFGLSALSDGGWLILGQYLLNDLSDSGLVLVRQRKDGQLDESFGEQGVRFLPYDDIGGPQDAGVAVGAADLDDKAFSEGSPRTAGITGTSAVQQQDGKIVLVSNVTDGSSQQKGIVLRLNSDGSTDKTFNESGFAIVELEGISYDWNVSNGVAVQVDGKVLVCGRYAGESPFSSGAYVMRFDATGRVDSGFNGGRAVTIPSSSGIGLSAISVREADGRIVAVGNSIRDGVSSGLIAVLNSGGSFNLVFNGGKPLFSELVPQGLSWRRCASQADGSVIVVGSTGRGSVAEGLSAVTARYLSDGSLDPMFNGKGFTVFDEEGVLESARDMALMTDGRIVVCGAFWRPAGGWMVRYLA